MRALLPRDEEIGLFVGSVIDLDFDQDETCPEAMMRLMRHVRSEEWED